MSRRLDLVVFALILAAYTWLAIGYGRATPLWNNPDEPAHYNGVAHIARTGTLPEIKPGDWDQKLLDRLITERFPPGESIDTIRYESWQPPLYYLLAAPVFLLAAPTVADQASALRLFDVFLGALTLLAAYLLGLETFRALHRTAAEPQPPLSRETRLLAAAVPGVMAGVPMFTAMSAAVNNDALANLLGVVLTLACLRLAVTAPTTRSAIVLGVLMAIAMLTKLTLTPFLGIGLGALVVGAFQARRSLASIAAHLAIAAVTMAVLLAPYVLRQGLTYGWGDLLAKTRHDSVVVDQPRAPAWTWDYTVRWLTITFHSFWAQFGWMGIPVRDWAYWLWGAVSGLGLVGLLLGGARRVTQKIDIRTIDPRPLILVLVFLGVLSVDVYHNLTFEQAQGRFLFPALGALCALLVLGVRWAGGLRFAPYAALALVAGLLALNAYTLERFLKPAFGG